MARRTVLALEWARFHIFRPEGRLIASRGYDGEKPGSMLIPWALQHTPAGWAVVVIRQNDYNGRRGEPVYDSTNVALFDPVSGSLKPALLSLPGRPTWLGSAGWTRERYMSALPQFAIADDGSVYATRGDAYLITIHSMDGKPVRAIAAEVDDIPVTETEFRKVLDAEIAEELRRPNAETPERVAALKKDGAIAGHADHRPILGRMILSPDRRLLVERLDLDPRPLANGDSTKWDLFGSDGVILGRVTAPPRRQLMLLDGESIYAIESDENDVQKLVRYRIILK